MLGIMILIMVVAFVIALPLKKPAEIYRPAEKTPIWARPLAKLAPEGVVFTDYSDSNLSRAKHTTLLRYAALVADILAARTEVEENHPELEKHWTAEGIHRWIMMAATHTQWNTSKLPEAIVTTIYTPTFNDGGIEAAVAELEAYTE